MQHDRVLFVSNYCEYCNNVLLFLKKSGAESQYQVVNIDTIRNRLPPYVTCVPTLIVNKNNKLTDDDLFKFIESDVQKEEQIEEFGFYEGMYSFIDGSDTSQPSQFFSSLDQPMVTTASSMPNGTHVGRGKANDQQYESLLQRRNAEVQTNRKPSEAELKRMYDKLFPQEEF